MKEKDDVSSILRKAGYKATSSRVDLLNALIESRKPLSAKEILKNFGKNKMDAVTIYRTLAVLESIGLIRKVDLRHDHIDYEFAGDDHHHLVCTSCNRIEDVKNCDLAKISKKTLKQSKNFHEIKQHSLEFFGICKKCALKR